MAHGSEVPSGGRPVVDCSGPARQVVQSATRPFRCDLAGTPGGIEKHHGNRRQRCGQRGGDRLRPLALAAARKTLATGPGFV